jgi:hypothetical protein
MTQLTLFSTILFSCPLANAAPNLEPLLTISSTPVFESTVNRENNLLTGAGDSDESSDGLSGSVTLSPMAIFNGLEYVVNLEYQASSYPVSVEALGGMIPGQILYGSIISESIVMGGGLRFYPTLGESDVQGLYLKMLMMYIAPTGDYTQYDLGPMLTKSPRLGYKAIYGDILVLEGEVGMNSSNVLEHDVVVSSLALGVRIGLAF